MNIDIDIDSIKGFLAVDEGQALHEYALQTSALGPCLEVGSYCGKSTVYLGAACRQKNGTLFALDHHRGSEEHQQGEEYHDPDLYDEPIPKDGQLSSFSRHARSRWAGRHRRAVGGHFRSGCASLGSRR